jgi:lipopolysaccharide/colanic/teichoic acid biosynthesis glycosyltransferase
LEKAEDPEKYYIEVIMQEKIRLYLEYVEKHKFFYDLALIFKTFQVIVKEKLFSGSSMQS